MPTCVRCGNEFDAVEHKPGLIGECPECGEETERERGVRRLYASRSLDESGSVFDITTAPPDLGLFNGGTGLQHNRDDS